MYEVFDTLEACSPGSDDGRLDVEGGCADDVCLGDTWPDVRSVKGRTTCYTLLAVAHCYWDDGQLVAFPDEDEDGTPDEDAGAVIVALNQPWDGGSDEGLALDANAGCFVDVLGLPDGISMTATSEGWALRALEWSEHRFSFYDFSDDDGVSGPDGYAEFLQFTDPAYR
ncbi:MAG: hypothetical protein ACOZNI_12305 [Myxococcota bacterium]